MHTYGGGQILINLCSFTVVPSSTIVINITRAAYTIRNNIQFEMELLEVNIFLSIFFITNLGCDCISGEIFERPLNETHE